MKTNDKQILVRHILITLVIALPIISFIVGKHYGENLAEQTYEKMLDVKANQVFEKRKAEIVLKYCDMPAPIIIQRPISEQ